GIHGSAGPAAVGATRTALNVAIFLASLGWGASAVHAVAGSHAPTAQLLPGVVKELATGKLLIAARDLPDGNFSEAVILLADYSSEGAMGLIVNRETEVPLARAFPQLKQVSALARILAGGPVATTRMVGLLRTTAPAADVRHIVGDVYLVATREPPERQIASGAGPHPLPGVFRVRRVGSRAVGAINRRGIVARAPGRISPDFRSRSVVCLAPSDPPDGRADGLTLGTLGHGDIGTWGHGDIGTCPYNH